MLISRKKPPPKSLQKNMHFFVKLKVNFNYIFCSDSETTNARNYCISVKHTGTHTFSEKVWVLVYSWSLYIQTRNIQGLTPFQNVLEKCQIWKGVSSCMFLQLMSFGQEHTRTYTFSRFFENRVTSSGVSPCMFHVCIYKNQEHTRSHTFSKNHENFLKTYKNSHLFNS